MSDLVSQQQKFASLFARLLTWAQSQGYAVTLDECYRPPEVAHLYAETHRGISASLHILRLAADINVWQGEHLCQLADEYRPLGDWWTAQDPDCRWGGHFASADLRHFSLAWEGRA